MKIEDFIESKLEWLRAHPEATPSPIFNGQRILNCVSAARPSFISKNFWLDEDQETLCYRFIDANIISELRGDELEVREEKIGRLIYAWHNAIIFERGGFFGNIFIFFNSGETEYVAISTMAAMFGPDASPEEMRQYFMGNVSPIKRNVWISTKHSKKTPIKLNLSRAEGQIFDHLKNHGQNHLNELVNIMRTTYGKTEAAYYKQISLSVKQGTLINNNDAISINYDVAELY